MTSRSIHLSAIAFTLLAIGSLSSTFAQGAPAKLDPPVKPTIEGKYLANDKASSLKFVSVVEEPPFSDKPALKLIFTEKDHSKAKDFTFITNGDYGNALTISLHYDGTIFSSSVGHNALKFSPFSSVGSINASDFTISGGNVSGRFSTNGKDTWMKDTWELDVKFAAPLPEKQRHAPAEVAAPSAQETAKAAEQKPAPVAGPSIPARDLPLPSDAYEVEYSAGVEQIQLTSKKSVSAVNKDLAARLKQDGWKSGAGSLIGKTNTILHVTKGDAKVTLMIQASNPGCTVKIFSEGLDWSDLPESSAPEKKAALSDRDETHDLEKQANQLLDKALKKLQKSL
jgi:hypothetical protein